MSTTFRGYLWAWFNATRKGSLDLFGTLTMAVGFGLWSWGRRSPESFTAVAAYFGVTPEAAMSDWVWWIPLAVGLLALAYRFVRAPYEMALAERGEHQKQVKQLGEQAKQAEFLIDIEHDGYYIAASDPAQPCALPGVWIVFYGIVITNRTERQIPLDLWLHVGLTTDGSQRYAEVSESSVPAWAVDHPNVEDDEPLDRVLNLPGLSAKRGYCATRMTHGILGMAGVKDTKELAEQRPFWLEAKNLLTDEARLHPMNYLALGIEREMKLGRAFRKHKQREQDA